LQETIATRDASPPTWLCKVGVSMTNTGKKDGNRRVCYHPFFIYFRGSPQVLFIPYVLLLGPWGIILLIVTPVVTYGCPWLGTIQVTVVRTRQ